MNIFTCSILPLNFNSSSNVAIILFLSLLTSCFHEMIWKHSTLGCLSLKKLPISMKNARSMHLKFQSLNDWENTQFRKGNKFNEFFLKIESSIGYAFDELMLNYSAKNIEKWDLEMCSMKSYTQPWWIDFSVTNKIVTKHCQRVQGFNNRSKI